MLSYLSALPWAKIGMWALGLGAAGYAVVKIAPAINDGRTSSQGSDVGKGTTQSPQMMPLFMQASGGANPGAMAAPLPPLGGESWVQPDVGNIGNSDVEISKINAGVSYAQIELQKYLFDKGLGSFSQPTATPNIMTNSVTQGTAPAGLPTKPYTLEEYNNAIKQKGTTLNIVNTTPGSNKVSDSEALAFISSQMKSSNRSAAVANIQKEGLSRGYSQLEISSLIKKAGY